MSEPTPTPVTTDLTVDVATSYVLIPVAELPAGSQITISIVVGLPAPAPVPAPEPIALPQRPRYLGSRQA